MICIICGNEFIKNIHSQIYCSRECYKISRKQYNKEYRQRPKIKEHLKEYQKERLRIPEIKEHKKKYKKEYDKKYYLNNKEKIQKQRKFYQQTSKGKEQNKKRIQKYQKTPKGKNASKRIRDKRQRNLGWNPLNEYFYNSEGHHINKIDIIYIPISYHFRGHSATKNKNMEPINTIAFFFLLMQNINELRKIIY